jgi:8-oxo-dGTP pyrophosphatase MutT (NUDIX family)
MAHALAVTAVRETFEETGLALGDRDGGTVKPDLRRLDYLLRAITPASSPIRFHARFFAAEASHFSGTLRGNGELLDLGWRPVGECLKLPIVDVTEYLLTRLAREQTLAWKKGEELFSFRNGVARLQ